MKLVTVQGSMQLEAKAAAAWRALVGDARREAGVTPILSSPAGAYRSEELVVDMWRNPAKYGASQGVAKPISLGGGGSVHQNGRCIDVNNWASFGDLVVSRGFRRSRRLDILAAAHGFYPDSRYPNEPWHYQHNGTTPAGGITEGPFDMLSDTEQTELLNKTREIHDVIFNPWYGIKWRQLAQHYWMLGQPLPQDIIAENDLHTTPDSPFREMVSANLPSSVADLPTNGEMGQALTSTVALVNEHADENKDEIIAAMPTGSGGSGEGPSSAYSLSLNIDAVPGTATGTATPQ